MQIKVETISQRQLLCCHIRANHPVSLVGTAWMHGLSVGSENSRYRDGVQVQQSHHSI